MFWVGLELLTDPLLDEGQEVLVIGHAAAHVHLLPCPLGCWACREREREPDSEIYKKEKVICSSTMNPLIKDHPQNQVYKVYRLQQINPVFEKLEP